MEISTAGYLVGGSLSARESNRKCQNDFAANTLNYLPISEFNNSLRLQDLFNFDFKLAGAK
jgi:hypothetical protein